MRKKILSVVKYSLWVSLFFSVFLLNSENTFSTEIEKGKETLQFRIKIKTAYKTPKEDSGYEAKTCEISTILKQIISRITKNNLHIKIDFEKFTKKWFVQDKLIDISYKKPVSCEIWLDKEGNILKSKNITEAFDFEQILPMNLPEKLEVGSSWNSDNEIKLPKGFPSLILKTVCTPANFRKIGGTDYVEITTETKGKQKTEYKGIDTEIIVDYSGNVVCNKSTGFLIDAETKGSLKIIGNNQLILENCTEFTLEETGK